jgi:hypothetical protein
MRITEEELHDIVMDEIMKSGNKKAKNKTMSTYGIRKKRIMREINKVPKEVLKDWKITETEKTIKLKYKKRIYSNKIAYYGKIANYDKKKFFIDGLTIELKDPRVIDEDVYAKGAFHTHVSSRDHRTVCIGEIRGSLASKVIQELPTTLETLNMNSVMNSRVGDYVKRHILPTIEWREDWYDYTKRG